MMRTLTITYDKSNEDVPTLCVSECDFYLFNVTPRVIKIFTGEKAESLYKVLTGQNIVVKLKGDEEDANKS